jgi:hypothetical protein
MIPQRSDDGRLEASDSKLHCVTIMDELGSGFGVRESRCIR